MENTFSLSSLTERQYSGEKSRFGRSASPSAVIPSEQNRKDKQKPRRLCVKKIFNAKAQSRKDEFKKYLASRGLYAKDVILSVDKI
jgi:hypothetical protein